MEVPLLNMLVLCAGYKLKSTSLTMSASNTWYSWCFIVFQELQILCFNDAIGECNDSLHLRLIIYRCILLWNNGIQNVSKQELLTNESQ